MNRTFISASVQRILPAAFLKAGICLLLSFYALSAWPQSWQPAGPDDFGQLSYSSATYTSIVFNGSTPYVVYRDGGNSDKATVMKLNTGGTAWEIVGTAGFSAGEALYTAIAFNGSTPYVAYSDGANGYKATVMKLNAGGTAWETVGTAGFSAGAAYYTSIAFNGSTPYVVYRDGGNANKATVMKLNAGGTAWETVGTAGFSAGVAAYTAIAFNGSTPYVAYLDGGNGGRATVKKLNAGGTAWETVGTAGFSAGGGQYTSIAFNGSTPYVVYQDGGNSDKATVMKLNTGGTAWETVGTAGFSVGGAYYTSIAFNGSTPYVAYEDAGNGNKVMVKKLNAGGTAWETVGTAGFSTPLSPSVSIAFNGSTPYVVCTAAGGKAMAMKLNAGATAWETVGPTGFSAGTDSRHTSIAFNGPTPYVAYKDGGNGNKATVMKLNAGGTGWDIVGTAGFSAGPASYTPIAFNGSTPYVAYRDESNGKATVMKLNAGGTGWELVGTAGFSAGSVETISLAFNGSTPYVAYSDGANGYKATVMKLNAGGTGWETVGAAGFSAGQAYSTSIAFNGSTPYVAYSDAGSGGKETVKKLNAGGTAWETVGTAGFSADYTSYTSIVFNGSTPYVAYMDGGNDNKATVMKLNAGGTAWETVGTAGFSAGVAYYTTMAFDGSTPYVAYRDEGNGSKATVMKLNVGGAAWETVGTAGFSAGEANYTSIGYNGAGKLYVVYASGAAFAKAFNIPPAISSFSPNSAGAGNTVTLTGTDFTGATSVSFGDVPASSFNVVSNTSITAVVGAGASGSVSVTTPGGTATLAGFAFLSPPSIISFTPSTGPVGTTVTITGTNFNTSPANNIVFFGATRANVTAATATSLTVTVPTGATHSAITVLNTGTGLVAYSRTFFLPTFTPNKGSITISDFDAAIDFTIPDESPGFVAIGDIDGDGKPDLVEGGSNVAVLRNTSNPGSISLATKVDVTPGGSVAIGDIDGDGKLDLAVLGWGISVLRNTSNSGNISFADKVDIEGFIFYYSIAIGDIDGDGRSDLIMISQENNSVSVLRNSGSQGSISFADRVDFATGSGPSSVAIGDIDNDGKADLAVVNNNSNTVSVLLNTSSSGSISFADRVDFTTGSSPYSVAIGDIDNDGKADLAIPNYSGNTVSVLRNTGSPGTISFADKMDFATGTSPSAIAISDINGDGKSDLAVTNVSDNTISILRNTGNSGSIGFAAHVDLTIGSWLYSLAIGDIDGDGKPDLAAGNIFLNKFSVMRNNSLQEATVVTTAPSAITSSSATLGGDVSSDGGAAVSERGVVYSLSLNPTTSDDKIQIGSGTGVYSQNVTGLNPGTSYHVRAYAINSVGTSYGSDLTFTTIALPPGITSFTPSTGPVGTLVTITGTNLNRPTTFSIGNTSAIVISNTGSSLVGMVMPGAITGTLSVTTAGGTATGAGNFTVTPTLYPNSQQGSKLVGTGAGNNQSPVQGYSVSISADGNTAVVGGPYTSDNIEYDGAAWIYTRSNGVWIQQGSKLVGTGERDFGAFQGYSVSISADGNTTIIGGPTDNASQGAAWVFTRTDGVWTQQGDKLVGTGNIGAAQQGISVALSADGNTAMLGGYGDDSAHGAVWVFTRNDGIWTQQGSKLVGTGAVGNALQGLAISLSADGNTAIVAGANDNAGHGAAWVFSWSGNFWVQQGSKLVGTDSEGFIQGSSVSLSADGNTAMVAGTNYNSGEGAAWTYTRSAGVWTQQGDKLTGIGTDGVSYISISVSLSADGNTAIVGGYTDYPGQDNPDQGGAWIYTRSGNIWTQQGNKLAGIDASVFAQQGTSVSLSADGTTAIMGGPNDSNNTEIQGAAWVFTAGTLSPAIGSFSPLNASAGSTVTLTGSNFTGATAVSFGGTPASSFNVVSATSIAAVVGLGASGSVTVTTPDGTTTLPGFTFLSSNAGLSALGLSVGTLSPVFASGTSYYTASVSNITSSVTITPVIEESNATVKVNGVTIASGSPSGSIPLTVGSNNNITTVVTAADGTTIQTYTVTITRAAPLFPYSESFKYSTAAGMVYGGTPASAALTAGSADAEGAGYLRLTNNSANQVGFARNTTAFPSANGLSISFEYYTHSGSGGDGLTFFLYDASANPFVAGASGGSLGYAQTTNSGGLPGVSKGYIGIGLDEAGNFSNPTAGRQGGPGQKASSVTLRGDGDGAATVAGNYEYLTSTQTSNAAAMSSAGGGSVFVLAGMTNGRSAISVARPQGGLIATNNGYRKAKVELTPNGQGTGYIVNVWITEGNAGGGILHHVITDYSYTGTTLPAFLSYGFASSTGAYSNIHEIRNLDITVPAGAGPLAPTVTDITKSGTQNVVVPFTASNFTSKFSDPANDPLVKIKVLSLPVNGTLKLSGTAITINQEINLANLGAITFVPAPGYTGTASFQWNGSDGTLYADIHGNVIMTLSATGINTFPYSESFKNSTAAGLVLGGTPAASLTAGGVDAEGAGYLRLTNNATAQLGFARNTRAFPTADGFSVSFEYYTYGGSAADGISFFLYDAAANGSFQIGAPGGSLGYAQNSVLPGLSKGYIGIGLDEFGGFSTGTGGRMGGPGQRVSSVTIRGDGNGAGAGSPGGSNYEYLTNIQTSNAAAMSLAGAGSAFQIAGGVNGRTGGAGGLTGTSPGYRKAKIEMTPNGTGNGYILNVWITEGNAAGPILHHVVTDYNYLSTSLAPANLSYGFAGSTGGYTNYHEIRNLEITLPGGVNIPEIMAIDNSMARNNMLTIWSPTLGEGGKKDAGTLNQVSPPVQASQPAATNILSPNRDGKNDTWVIRNLDKYPRNTVTIVDRNGKVVYRKENYRNDWDGTFRGVVLAEDTYYYIVDFGKGIGALRGFISIVK